MCEIIQLQWRRRVSAIGWNTMKRKRTVMVWTNRGVRWRVIVIVTMNSAVYYFVFHLQGVAQSVQFI